MSVRAPFCSLDTWPAGWTPEQFWKVVPFRESNPDIPVIKPIARSLCLLKYSGYFCLRHKPDLTADIPFYFWAAFQEDCGPSSSVGITTEYRLDGPGSNPGGDEIFCTSRPALGPTQPPVKWVPGLSRGSSAAGACC